MSDKPVLRTPGEVLLEARRKADLDLDEVAERTKIPVPILHSLELDEYHKISGPLYVNSFLRTYAVDLGLDSAYVLELYAKFSGEYVGGGPDPDAPAVWTEDEVEIRRVGLPWGWIGAGAGAVIVGIILVVWLLGRGGGDEPRASEAPVPEQAHESLLAERQQSADPADLVGKDANQPAAGSGERNGSLADASLEHLVPTGEEPADRPESGAAESTSAVSAVSNARDELPAAAPGVPDLDFADGTRWPVVLRLLCSEPVDVRVVRDADRIVSTAQWRGDVHSHPILPLAGIRQGQPYLTADGMAVYWGARDQFSLRLDRTDDVEVTLNGRRRDITDLQPGQEIILFTP